MVRDDYFRVHSGEEFDVPKEIRPLQVVALDLYDMLMGAENGEVIEVNPAGSQLLIDRKTANILLHEIMTHFQINEDGECGTSRREFASQARREKKMKEAYARKILERERAGKMTPPVQDPTDDNPPPEIEDFGTSQDGFTTGDRNPLDS